MKYLVILIGVIGLVTYIFVGGPKKALSGDEPGFSRAQQVADRIADLEHRRRDMLVRAYGRMGSYTPVASLSRKGAYAAGYREGFGQGYFEGSFLAGRTGPNPLFFPIP
ncbi:hypothetical protein DFW101_3051 [Solidesulfovibrio carbinoliphilus subsp. oakridgensis]|uniref:Uncharacterized protein n=1 Tax=Solidesulfovibrio carbinoliphilus subsp. oakridgensis TaxID=694327 RepID=G7Q794_9BACT|nr:hypothetical protein [Solidesulfovibrio carbinoliphilus]EHJ49051.1 hypothetical protein DFW101_3051 [Solidesulfovibrio carbinoliphilus subsp. oakridgensis]